MNRIANFNFSSTQTWLFALALMSSGLVATHFATSDSGLSSADAAPPISKRLDPANAPAPQSVAPQSVAAPSWQALLDLINSRIDLARAHRKVVQHRVAQERKLHEARLAADLAARERERILEGEVERERQILKDEVQLAMQRHGQAARRVKWSVRLANEGLISQESLDLDQAALESTESVLKAAPERKLVFEKLKRQRLKVQADAVLEVAKANVEQLEQLGAAAEKELKTKESLAKQHHNRLVKRVAALPSIAANRPANVERQALPLVEATLRRAEEEAKVQKQFAKMRVREAEGMIQVAQLELQEFIKSERTERRQELLDKINSISESLAAAQQQVTWSLRVIKKQYVTQTQLLADQLVVQQQRAAMRQAELELKILDEHTLPADEFKLRADVENAKLELKLRERISTALIDEANVVVQAKRETLAIHRGNYSSINFSLSTEDHSTAETDY